MRNGFIGNGVSTVVKRLFLIAPLLAAPAVAQDRTPATDRVRCSLNYAPDRTCRLTDTVGRGGYHRMVFAIGGRQLTFVGKKQTGWWAGKLNGKPAMGYERNRGNVVFSTYDLSTSFSWWYPTNAHGTY